MYVWYVLNFMMLAFSSALLTVNRLLYMQPTSLDSMSKFLTDEIFINCWKKICSIFRDASDKNIK
jgi:hypothetical protein